MKIKHSEKFTLELTREEFTLLEYLLDQFASGDIDMPLRDGVDSDSDYPMVFEWVEDFSYYLRPDDPEIW